MFILELSINVWFKKQFERREIYMADNQNYIKWIRSKVGHEKVILTFAGGCIFNERGEVLLQRRGDFNKWGFPGGAIELGETPQMAAIREAKEETGLDVKVNKLIGIYTDFNIEYPNGDKAQSLLIAFVLDVIGGEMFCDKEETLELRYFSLDHMPELFCKQHKDFLYDIKSKQYGVVR
jgi:mutator protein MutT